MFRLLQLAVFLLLSVAHGFSVQPGMLGARGAAPACEMKLALRTNDMVKVISGKDKVCVLARSVCSCSTGGDAERGCGSCHGMENEWSTSEAARHSHAWRRARHLCCWPVGRGAAALAFSSAHHNVLAVAVSFPVY